MECVDCPLQYIDVVGLHEFDCLFFRDDRQQAAVRTALEDEAVAVDLLAGRQVFSEEVARIGAQPLAGPDGTERYLDGGGTAQRTGHGFVHCAAGPARAL